ncbi:MAG: DUF4215 domain-containing protein [Myxococcales bacterium]|nr:DUF4215 domain-containing protein [Myxococcales bacterium]MCB9519500.1 DUF4215 domain-containing protein [Myxococcales bacterium]MCB9532100.1 DUF4215 domain-containing protein [Myxococcales bacterium]MCB9533275.1 DUF4215 domain-containing protein [Myxococcales bacterium]
MPTTACVDRPGGSADEVSFQVSLTGSGGVTVTGTQDCLAVECGNEAVQGTEECDDGNTADNDGCSATCTIEGCGDGTQQLSEACDDGNLVSGDGCSDICEIDNLECYDVDISFSSSSPLASADTNFWADGVTSTCGGAGRGDVSYLWTAPYTGIWEFNDTGSSIDTIVAIYSATSGVCGAELDCSNVIGGGSTVVQNADWEEEYVIVVSGSSADGAVTLDVVAPALPPSDTTTGPDSDDPRVVLRGTNFWNLGDSVTMDFTTGYPSITGLEMHLVLANNFLSTTRCRDGVPEQNVTVTVNGNTVGTFTVGPGDTSIDEVFSFAAISGPNYTVAYTTSAEVSSGCGSSGYATSGSTVTLVQ